MISHNNIKPCFKNHFEVIFEMMLIRKENGFNKKRTISLAFVVTIFQNNHANYKN